MTAPLDEKGLEAARKAVGTIPGAALWAEVEKAIRAYLAASPSPSEMEVVADDGAPWVLLKRGMFWRPGGQGYTGIKAQAGRYSDDQAIGYSLHDEGGTTRMLWADAPELAPSCPAETAVEHYRAQVLRLTEENEALRKSGDEWERRFFVMDGHFDKERVRAETAEARIKALEEALRPFARHIDEMKFDLDNKGNELPDEQAVGWVYVTNGDFRRARTALKENAI